MTFEIYRQHRHAGDIPAEAARQAGKPFMAYKWERRLKASTDPELYAGMRSASSKRAPVPAHANKVLALQERVAQLEQQLSTFMVPSTSLEGLGKSQRGHVAEALVIYRLRRFGLEVVQPQVPIKGGDILVLGPNRTVNRIEVKGTTNPRQVSVCRMLGRKSAGDEVKTHYLPGEVDFFALVDLIHEHVFIVPYDEIGPKVASYSLLPAAPMWRFKDRFDLFTGV